MIDSPRSAEETDDFPAPGRAIAPVAKGPRPQETAKRLLDISVASIALIVLTPLLAVLAIAIRATSPGPIMHRSRRIGQFGVEFHMHKFRTMRVGTPQVATHELTDAHSHLTQIGGFLRRASLDELPQLVNVIRGEMSLVGPRPALYNQTDLIAQREALGIDRLRPGITGLAQVRGRDELSVGEKVAIDLEYLETASMRLDLSILTSTLLSAAKRENVSH